MLTNRTLARINSRPREVARLPLLVVGGGTLVLAALLYVSGLLPSFVVLAVLGGGVLLVLLLYISQKAKTTVSLSYKSKLDEATSGRFTSVREALEGLASSGRVWRLAGSVRLPKSGEVVHPSHPILHDPRKDRVVRGGAELAAPRKIYCKSSLEVSGMPKSGLNDK